MLHTKPVPLNVNPNDTTGNTWTLPDGALVRIGKGYKDNHLNSRIVLSPDYTYFVVGTSIGIWWYEISTMTPIALWETKRGNIKALDISPDGKLVAITNWDGILKIKDIESNDIITQKESTVERNLYTHIAFSPDSECIALANENGVIEIVEVQSGSSIAQMDRSSQEEHTGPISQLKFSPDGQYIAATALRQTHLWNPNTGTKIVSSEGTNFTFSLDSRLLIYENLIRIPNTTPPRSAKTVSIWDIELDKLIRTFSEHYYIHKTTAISPCNKFITMVDIDRGMHTWDIKTGVLKDTYKDFNQSWVKPHYLADGSLLATVFTQETIEVRNVKQNEILHTFEKKVDSIGYNWFSKCPEILIAHSLTRPEETSDKRHTFASLYDPACLPNSVSYSTDGKTLAIQGYSKGIVLWDMKSRQTYKELVNNELVAAFTYLICGNILAISSYRDLNTGRDIYRVWNIGNTSEDVIAEFSPTIELGRRTFAFMDSKIAFGGKSGSLYLWDPKHDIEPNSLIGHSEHIWSLAFSPDGKKLFSGSSDKTVRSWDVESCKELDRLPVEFTTNSLAHSPCGGMIAGGMLNQIRLWCAEKLTLIQTIPHSEDNKRPFALEFSPCGRYLASGTWWQKGMEKMAIYIWDVETGENITTFYGHTSDIQTLTYSPDGTLLVSGGFDGTLLIWDMKPYLNF